MTTPYASWESARAQLVRSAEQLEHQAAQVRALIAQGDKLFSEAQAALPGLPWSDPDVTTQSRPTVAARLEQLMRERPGHEFSVRELTEALGDARSATVRQTLLRMAEREQGIEKVDTRFRWSPVEEG
ncbi:hypothetical protein ACIBG8_36245 [Nonomuraea sp. NPDC050556]|uniref:hypothetical protein n=1 Tax=Nonomuraea sp. NPDC050556 TaxID=3364369 RepID=UPI0037BCE43C